MSVPVDWCTKKQAAKLIGRTERTLSRIVRDLPREDRRLLALRYRQQHTVQRIAKNMGVDAKRLYRRFDRTLLSLRTALQAQGVTGAATRLTA